MIKKFLSLFAIASTMLATSCSNDEITNVTEENTSTVTFNTQLANVMQTRAFADGTTANTLTYAVYKVEGDTWTYLTDLSKTDQTFTGKANISLNLVNGKTYAVVFWADAASSIYTFDATNITVNANYTSATSSNEAYDAFYAVEEFTTDGATLNRTVELKRPFAQLNIGTSDLAAAKAGGIDVKKVGITAPTYSTLNLKTGAVEGNKTEVTFGAVALTDIQSETFPAGTGCQYLAMSYLLMPETKEADNTVKVSYYNDANTEVANARTFNNIPLQRNYRTNIFGTLLTSTNNFTVQINPAFNDPATEMIVWDGPTAKKVVPNAEGVYEINDSQELAWIAYQTKQGNQFNGKTVKLMNDINLAGIDWFPIGDNSITVCPGHDFAGTFDGNNKTISNLTVKSTVAENAAAGLFGTVVSATIKNLTIKNANVTSSHYAAAIAAYSEGYSNFENCTVENSTITSTPEWLGTEWDNGDKAGGIVGYMIDANVKNCTVKSTTIKAYRDLGGIVGFANGTSTVTDNTIDNVTLTVDKTHNYKNYTTDTQYDANHYVGEKSSGATVNNNTGEATINY